MRKEQDYYTARPSYASAVFEFWHPARSEAVVIDYNDKRYVHSKPNKKVKHNENLIEWQYWDCVEWWSK